MVSSQSQSVATEQHVRGCHRGRNGDASDSEKSRRATVQKRPRGVAEPPYDCLYICLSDLILSLRTVRSPLRRYLRYCTVTSLLPTPTAAVLLIIRGQTVSSPATSSHKTDVRNSARRVNSDLDTYLSTYTAGCQSCCSCPAIVAAPPQNARRELAVLAYLVK